MLNLSLSVLRDIPREEWEPLATIRGNTALFDDTSEGWKALNAKHHIFVPPGTPRPPRANAPARSDHPRMGCSEWKATRAALAWAALHRRPFTAPDPPDAKAERRWLGRFARGIPCDECLFHWMRVTIEQLPPDFSSRDAYFVWGVAAHNAINRLIGKPELPLEEARGMYDPPKPE